MDKINELIEIKDAYSEQVNIREDFLDTKSNLKRMERYMPIKSHRKAFEKVATGLFERNNKRFYLLTGSYGTGKSHLSLMIANYLSNSSDSDEIIQFFENYRHMVNEDGEKEDSIDKFVNIQKNKRYLVCICDYDSNDTFMEIVLKAIMSALEREKIDPDQLNTPYQEAIRKINEWEDLKINQNHDFLDKFEKLLARELPGTTLNQFKKGLEKELDYDKLKVFRKLHKEITTAEFVFSKDNLVAIAKGLIESKIFKDSFDGILILFDEFDYVLKNRSRFDLNVFQAFGEFCAASFMNGTPVITLAITHRSFVSYKSQFNDTDFSVVNSRVEEISLATEGFEDIIAAIVIPQTDSGLWATYIKPRKDTFNALTQSCQEYGIFKHLSDSGRKLRKKIVENIYPMHPMATYVLLELSKKIGANNRSVITFFTKKNRKDEEGSYRWFIENNNILNEKDDMNFYTTDLIFDYFSTLITSDNTELSDSVRSIIRNYESSLREWKKLHSKEMKLFDDENDLIVDKILKVLVLFQLADVVTNSNNILFGLNANLYEDDRRKIDSVLKYLVSNQILYHNRQSDSFEFRKSDLIDIDGTIEGYISQEENFSINVVSELDRLAKNKAYKDLYDLFRENFIEGDSYNREWHEDKRFLRLFITINELESPDFYSKISNMLVQETNYKNSFEGIAVFVLCESLDECERAKDIANKNKNSKIIIAVPNEEIPLKEDIVRVIAAESSFNKDLS